MKYLILKILCNETVDVDSAEDQDLDFEFQKIAYLRVFILTESSPTPSAYYPPCFGMNKF